MDVRPVDPRDETSAVDDPAYRVFFWDEHMTSYEYDITRDGGVTLVRLAGWDAATPDGARTGWAVSLRA